MSTRLVDSTWRQSMVLAQDRDIDAARTASRSAKEPWKWRCSVSTETTGPRPRTSKAGSAVGRGYRRVSLEGDERFTRNDLDGNYLGCYEL